MTKKSPKQRPPKKTVSIEVRVSEEDKRDFIEACRTANRSVSSALRGLMRGFVVFQRSRHRMFETMTRLLFRPVRMALASLGAAAALSTSLILAPGASADMPLAYQVALDDGAGVIVSMGELDLSDNEAVTDRLGDDVLFHLGGGICEAPDAPECAQELLVLQVSEFRDGEAFHENHMGIEVAETGLTTFETQLSDGRTVTVLIEPRAKH